MAATNHARTNEARRLRTYLLFAGLFLGAPAAWGQPAARDWSPAIEWSPPEPVGCPEDGAPAKLVKDAALGRLDAQARLGRLKLSCQKMFDPAEGMRLLEAAAVKGNSRAQFALADGYRNARLGRADAAQAVSWYRKAALHDDARARNNWAVALYFGMGAAKDPEAAFKLFQIAARQGLRQAEYNLGTLYDLGFGVARSYPDARRWYDKAGQQGDGPAEYRLGMLWELGLGGEKNRQTAVEWYTRAEQNGSAAAMLRLGLDPSRAPILLYTAGVALLFGNGVPKDEAEGMALLQQAAARDFPLAYFQLGDAYANGRGVKKNEAKAIDYYETVIKTDRTLAAVAYNNIAWVRVTSTDPRIHDPQKALDYALKGVDLGAGRQAYAVDTLANAYFQVGQTDKAIETENKALSLQPRNAAYAATLARFREAREHPRTARQSGPTR